MDIKNNLCQSFCDSMSVTKIPVGYAVGTSYEGVDGDHIGFYVVGPNDLGQYHVQDDGLTIATLEALGVDLDNKSRKAMFSELRDQYAIFFEADTGELKTVSVSAAVIGQTAIRFMAFMLRLQDLLFTTNERVTSTFKDDVVKILSEVLDGRAELIPNYVLTQKLEEYPADLGIISKGRRPIALFFGVSEVRILEALLLQSNAEKIGFTCSVVALLETDDFISKKSRARANNHLAAVPVFKEDQYASCRRVVRDLLES